MKKVFLVLLAFLVLSLFSCASPQITTYNSGENSDKTNKSVKEISYGSQVDIQKYIKKGKVTIFDFYSEYCPPCRRISPLLDKLAKKRDDIFVVKVNINRPGVRGIDWSSPVARQYGLRSIPHFKIYSKDGKLKMEGRDAYEYILHMLRDEGLLN